MTNSVCRTVVGERVCSLHSAVHVTASFFVASR